MDFSASVGFGISQWISSGRLPGFISGNQTPYAAVFRVPNEPPLRAPQWFAFAILEISRVGLRIYQSGTD